MGWDRALKALSAFWGTSVCVLCGRLPLSRGFQWVALRPQACWERSVGFRGGSTGEASAGPRGCWGGGGQSPRRRPGALWSDVQGAHNGEARVLAVVAAVLIRAGTGVAGGS